MANLQINTFLRANFSDLTNLCCATSPEVFFHQIMLPVMEHADGSFIKNSLLERPWLNDFHVVSDFHDSRSAFIEDPNSMTIALMNHLGLYASSLLFEDFSKPEKDPDLMIKKASDLKWPLDENSMVVYDFMRTQLPSRVVDLRRGHAWSRFRERVNNFSLLVGCARAPANPFEAIDALRVMALENSASAGLEAKHQAEVAFLREQIKDYEDRHRTQSRIIANLSYRYLLEHLPGPAPMGESNTANWQKFWKQALQNANQSPNHPLAPLLTRFGHDARSVSQIRSVGQTMYGTLSTNIHHFRGVYHIDQNQWDVLPGAILQALAPTKINPDGSVDWDAERARY
jgi:hypothetical protein